MDRIEGGQPIESSVGPPSPNRPEVPDERLLLSVLSEQNRIGVREDKPDYYKVESPDLPQIREVERFQQV
jgi:hypothetical protein